MYSLIHRLKNDETGKNKAKKLKGIEKSVLNYHIYYMDYISYNST